MPDAHSYTLITGASSGLGASLARLLARDSGPMILCARRRDRLDAVAAECRTLGSPSIEIVEGDLAPAGGADALIAEIASRGLRVGTLVNNAGFGMYGDFTEAAADRIDEMIRLNVGALTRLTWHYAREMRNATGGRIMNVASLAGFQPGPHFAAYSATKAYVLSLSEAVTEELRGTGVHVICYAPGPTTTEFGVVAGITSVESIPGSTTAEDVARGMQHALRTCPAVRVHGLLNSLGAFMVRLFPRWVVTRISGWVLLLARAKKAKA
jgi:short-subunit dehydrogenase